jgi:hypothetical protein
VYSNLVGGGEGGEGGGVNSQSHQFEEDRYCGSISYVLKIVAYCCNPIV